MSVFRLNPFRYLHFARIVHSLRQCCTRLQCTRWVHSRQKLLTYIESGRYAVQPLIVFEPEKTSMLCTLPHYCVPLANMMSRRLCCIVFWRARGEADGEQSRHTLFGQAQKYLVKRENKTVDRGPETVRRSTALSLPPGVSPRPPCPPRTSHLTTHPRPSTLQLCSLSLSDARKRNPHASCIYLHHTPTRRVQLLRYIFAASPEHEPPPIRHLRQSSRTSEQQATKQSTASMGITLSSR